MKKKTILITGLLTIGIMSLIGIGCSKKSVTPTETEQGVTYESQKARIAELEKKIGKTRSLITNSNSWTSSSNVPIPSITKFMYCLSGPSPLGSNYIRFKYRVDVDNITKMSVQGLPINVNDRNPVKKQLEYRIFNDGVYGNVGYKFVMPFGTANASCIYLDALVTSTLTVPQYITASIQNSNSNTPSAVYNVNGYGNNVNGPIGFVLNSQNIPTLSISKANLVDSWDGTNICP